MDEIKRISSLEFNDIASKHSFNRNLLVKDYYITLVLCLIKNISGIYFKGGTALNKIFLKHARLSEDIDFTVTHNEKEIKKEIEVILLKSGFFSTITEGKNIEGFTRIVMEYNSDLGSDKIFIDLNKKAKLFLPSEEHIVSHFYFPFISDFSLKTIAKEELIAEKVRAAITRNKPRDHFDIYQIIQYGNRINLELAKKKCEDVGAEFSIIRMFNKAKALNNRWDKDMVNLLPEPVAFKEVIQFLAKYFKLKEEKRILKEKIDTTNN